MKNIRLYRVLYNLVATISFVTKGFHRLPIFPFCYLNIVMFVLKIQGELEEMNFRPNLNVFQTKVFSRLIHFLPKISETHYFDSI